MFQDYKDLLSALPAHGFKYPSVTSPKINVIFAYNNGLGAAMHTTNLRKVGGSVMLAVPPVLLKMLQLEPGATVGVDVEDGRLIVEPQRKPRYTLEELLAASDYSRPQPPEEREWVDAPAVGGELI